ncbi:MAG: hypothetical protein AAF939_17745 [Planctomycetota bacterium]
MMISTFFLGKKNISFQPDRKDAQSCVLFYMVIIAIALVPGKSFGQNNGSGNRPVPAPWRPSFGQVAPQNSNDNSGNPSSTSVTQGPQANSTAPPPRQPDPNQQVTNQQGPGQQQPSRSTNQTDLPNSPFGSNTGSTETRSITRSSQSGGRTRVSRTFNQLPNSAGQVWREYDISPYTSRIKDSEKPHKAILDWILRETGQELWFNEPLGILNISKDRLLVYHTPEIQTVVKRLIDRFVWTRGQVQEVDIHLVTVDNPNWRSQSYSMLQPIDVKSPGVEAWMVSKENASILLAQLRRRVDFKEHGGGRVRSPDGQPFVIQKTEPVQFIRSLRWVPNQVPNYQPLLTQIEEGYRLEISTLSSIENEAIEAMIHCEVDQVEKLNPVTVGLPNYAGGAEEMNLQIPQLISWRLKERFRWPNDQVLLLSCGVVAKPDPQRQRLPIRFPGANLTGGRGDRADALLFIDYRGPANEAAVPLLSNRPNDRPNR